MRKKMKTSNNDDVGPLESEEMDFEWREAGTAGGPGADDDDDLCDAKRTEVQKRVGMLRFGGVYLSIAWNRGGGRVAGKRCREEGRRGGGEEGRGVGRRKRGPARVSPYHEARHAPLCQADGDGPAYERCRAQRRSCCAEARCSCSEKMQTGLDWSEEKGKQQQTTGRMDGWMDGWMDGRIVGQRQGAHSPDRPPQEPALPYSLEARRRPLRDETHAT